MHQPSLSIIITTFNSEKVIENCLNKINFDDFEVYIVDNASSDNTLSKVKNNFPLAKIIANTKNLGYSRGNNCALKIIKSDFALILNPDAFIFDEDLKKTLSLIATNPQIAILAPLLLNFYPAQNDDIAKEIAVVNGNLINIFPDFTSVKYVVGACMILRMEVFKKIGFFDERIFLYYEDDEISWRAIKNGYICGVKTDCYSFHIGSGSSGSSSRQIYRRFFHRALSKFYWKEKQKNFQSAYFSAIKLAISYFLQAIFYVIIFNRQKVFKYLGAFVGTLSYLLRLTAFDKNDNPRG
jgi:N-acetylglucosaminyl-diphospho-decaprenol L-rhamnosyltransferase